VSRGQRDALLLGEWACLGILAAGPAHGYDVAARLKPGGDIGRVWSLSRALTYRALDQLTGRGYVEPVGVEPGLAGGERTILAPTPAGRAQLRRWLAEPVLHLRDLRSELVLKLVLCGVCQVDTAPLVAAQRAHAEDMAAALEAQMATDPADVVVLWRHEAAQAALRFLDHLPAAQGR